MLFEGSHAIGVSELATNRRAILLLAFCQHLAVLHAKITFHHCWRCDSEASIVPYATLIEPAKKELLKCFRLSVLLG